MVSDETRRSSAATFLSVARRGHATVETKGSEFLAYAGPVENVSEAEAFVEEIRDAHPDATHVVSAYRVRDDADVLREQSNDAGEPSGSAGKPALTVLSRRDLENVAVVIVRFFGGTELGVGGLARAYGEATKEALSAAVETERRPHRRVAIEGSYDDSGRLRGVLESEGVEFEAAYGERVRFDATVPVADLDRVTERLMDATSGRAEIETD